MLLIVVSVLLVTGAAAASASPAAPPRASTPAGAGAAAVGPAGTSTAAWSSTARSTAARWSWPLTTLRLLRDYLAPAERWSAGHRGIDLAATRGDEVLAPADGVVHFSGIVVDRPVLSIRHEGGLLSSFEPVTSELAAGDSVRRGQPVGVLAESSGHCAQDCLHLGARLDGEYVSPMLLLGLLSDSVLLPTRSLP